MGRRYVANKMMNRILNELIQEGWNIYKHRQHYKIYDPSGSMRAVAAVTPSDRRAPLNFRADIKRAREAYDKVRASVSYHG